MKKELAVGNKLDSVETCAHSRPARTASEPPGFVRERITDVVDMQGARYPILDASFDSNVSSCALECSPVSLSSASATSKWVEIEQIFLEIGIIEFTI